MIVSLTCAVTLILGMNSEHTIMIWSLEYCEFCWTIFRLFDALGLEYKVGNGWCASEWLASVFTTRLTFNTLTP